MCIPLTFSMTTYILKTLWILFLNSRVLPLFNQRLLNYLKYNTTSHDTFVSNDVKCSRSIEVDINKK